MESSERQTGIRRACQGVLRCLPLGGVKEALMKLGQLRPSLKFNMVRHSGEILSTEHEKLGILPRE